jgi:cytoskeletal protein RodZ
MSELGSRLKQARLAKGVSLRQIEASTKISVGALEALEKDDYARLPGGIFARSFVRAYAGAVGLNPDDTVHEFLTEYEKFERDNERSAKRPEITPDDLEFLERQRRAVRTLRLVLVVVAVLLVTAVAYIALVWWPARAAQGPTIPGT